MLSVLAKIHDEAGGLIGARYALFNGDLGFITAIELCFERMSAVFRANPDDDTLQVAIGSLSLDTTETVVDATDSHFWSPCCGQSLSWAWRLTNQQGYTDGVRLEFNAPPEQRFSSVVELVVIASAIALHISSPAVVA